MYYQLVVTNISFFYVLGSILEGPNPENLKPLAEQAMPMLIELLKDPSIAVRDTAAWTVSRHFPSFVHHVVRDA